MLAFRGLCPVMIDTVLVCNTTNACPKAFDIPAFKYWKQMENYKLLA